MIHWPSHCTRPKLSLHDDDKLLPLVDRRRGERLFNRLLGQLRLRERDPSAAVAGRYRQPAGLAPGLVLLGRLRLSPSGHTELRDAPCRGGHAHREEAPACERAHAALTSASKRQAAPARCNHRQPRRDHIGVAHRSSCGAGAPSRPREGGPCTGRARTGAPRRSCLPHTRAPRRRRAS